MSITQSRRQLNTLRIKIRQLEKTIPEKMNVQVQTRLMRNPGMGKVRSEFDAKRKNHYSF